MSRSTLILTAGGGALAAFAIQGAAGNALEAARFVADVAATAAILGGTASVAWYWPKGRIEVRTAVAVASVRRRHHRGDRAPLPGLGRRPATEAEQPHSDAVPAQPEPEPEAEEQPARAEQVQATPIVAPPMPERPRALDMTAVDWPRPPEVDPYLTPANLDADGYPVPPFRTAEDATRDLAGLGDAQMIPAHREPADGWEQLREPAATRSADDLLWYSPAGPA